MRENKFIIKNHSNQLHILRIFLILLVLFSLSVAGSTIHVAQNYFFDYINDTYWDYWNVLILGVGADWDRELELMRKYHFDLIIPISQRGNVIDDSLRAAIERLGIPTGTLEDLKDKKIKNLYAHSWGTSRAVNYLSEMKIEQLHCIGSPESAFVNQTLIDALEKGKVGKVFFHINDDDKITYFRHLPKFGLGGGFRGDIEFYFYTKERSDIDTKYKKAFIIPIFNVPIGFDRRVFYNCPDKGHGLESYFNNFAFIMNRGVEGAPFHSKDSPPFYIVPSYFVLIDPYNRGKSMTEAQILTEIVHNKNKAIIIGKGPEADLMYRNMVKKLGEANVKRIYTYSDEKTLQLEARKFGADVILGVKGPKLPETTKQGRASERDIGNKYYKNNSVNHPPPPPPFSTMVKGVWIDPKPTKAGKGGSEIKKEALKSRPSEDAPSWLVDIPKEVK